MNIVRIYLKMDTKKRERFINVAGRRVERVLEGLDSLTKCSNTKNYSYTDEDVAKMLKIIKERVKILEMAYLSNTHKKSKTNFQFDS